MQEPPPWKNTPSGEAFPTSFTPAPFTNLKVPDVSFAVFLTEGGTGDILAYIDEFLIANGQHPSPKGRNSCGWTWTVSPSGWNSIPSSCLSALSRRGANRQLAASDAFDASDSILPLPGRRHTGAGLSRHLAGNRRATAWDQSREGWRDDANRAIASNLFSDRAAQLNFAFDIDDAGFSRITIFNEHIRQPMGRVVQRIVELETYRMLALLDLRRCASMVQRSAGSSVRSAA